jgi:hypothetical protein
MEHCVEATITMVLRCLEAVEKPGEFACHREVVRKAVGRADGASGPELEELGGGRGEEDGR